MRSYKREPNLHKPVLKGEVIEALRLDEFAHSKKRAVIVDATLGTGGHAVEILIRGSKVLGIEADREMLKVAEERFKKACPSLNYTVQGSFKLVHGNFRNINRFAKDNGFERVDGILFDLGVATPQLTSAKRGFSFQNPNAALDMRIDETSQGVTAADLLATLGEKQLVELFGVVLERFQARALAKAVVRSRKSRPIKTVGDLLEATEESIRPGGKLHPATKGLLALRIAVNSELANLKEALPNAFELLARGGRLVVISFHSGEDGLTKEFFRQKEKEKEARILSKKPIVPGTTEVRINPRARSAKMRVLEKI